MLWFVDGASTPSEELKSVIMLGHIIGLLCRVPLFILRRADCSRFTVPTRPQTGGCICWRCSPGQLAMPPHYVHCHESLTPKTLCCDVHASFELIPNYPSLIGSICVWNPKTSSTWFEAALLFQHGSQHTLIDSQSSISLYCSLPGNRTENLPHGCSYKTATYECISHERSALIFRQMLLTSNDRLSLSQYLTVDFSIN